MITFSPTVRQKRPLSPSVKRERLLLLTEWGLPLDTLLWRFDIDRPRATATLRFGGVEYRGHGRNLLDALGSAKAAYVAAPSAGCVPGLTMAHRGRNGGTMQLSKAQPHFHSTATVDACTRVQYSEGAPLPALATATAKAMSCASSTVTTGRNMCSGLTVRNSPRME